MPKLKGRRNGETVLMHAIRHDEVHATLTEAELARDHVSVDALRRHPRPVRFVAWIRDKDPAFHSRTAKPARRLRR